MAIQKNQGRVEIVKALFGLGLSGKEIATLINGSPATIGKDIWDIGGEKKYPDRPKTKKSAYQTAFRKYAELSGNGQLTEADSALRDLLEKFLEVAFIKAALIGTEKALTQLMELRESGSAVYVKLLNSIMSIAGYERPTSTEHFFETCVKAINRCPRLAPTSTANAVNVFAKWYVCRYEQCLHPCLTREAMELIDKVLATLTPQEEEVVRLEFGINVAVHTREQVALKLSLVRERIRQIEAKAIRKLRHPSRLKYLKQLNLTVMEMSVEIAKTATEEFEQRQAAQHPAPVEVAPKDSRENALKRYRDRSIEDLDISTRTFNCLRNRDVKTFGQLVQLTDTDLLKTKNFGRKSLWEIENVLRELGLRLGMTLPEATA